MVRCILFTILFQNPYGVSPCGFFAAKIFNTF